MQRSKLLLIVGITAHASALSLQAQEPTMQCNVSANAGSIRSESITDLAGDILFGCTGGIPATTSATFRVTTNTPITSRILDNASVLTEAILLIDIPFGPRSPYVTPVLGQNAFQAVLTGPNSIEFRNVPIVAPGAHTYRIKNLRVNAPLLPPDVQAGMRFATAALTVTPAGASSAAMNYIAPVTGDGRLIIAYAEPQGMKITLQAANGDSISSIAFTRPGGQNAQLVASPIATGAIATQYLSLEASPCSAFRNAGEESGFSSSSFPEPSRSGGLATNGTRLMAHFSGVPAGVSLYVTVSPVNLPPGASRLIATDVNGAGAYSPVAATTSIPVDLPPYCPACPQTAGIAPVALSGGVGAAVWEIVDQSLSACRPHQFGIVVAYAAPVPGTASVRATFAPLSSIGAADYTAPVPRFWQAPADIAPPALVSPANGAVLGADASVVLSWSASGGADDAVYDVYFGNTSPPAYAATTNSTTFTSVLTGNGTYYWKVVARAANSAAASSPVWAFNVATPQPASAAPPPPPPLRTIQTAGADGVTALMSGTERTTYSVAVAAMGGTPPYRWSMVSGSLPPGVDLMPNGNIFGVPSGSGTFTFQAVVTDAIGRTAAGTWTVTINAQPLAITTTALPEFSRGAISSALGASGGTPPYGWSLASGVLPPGLSLSSTGVLGGATDATGVFEFSARVTDARGAAATRAFSLVIVVPHLIITTGSLPPGTSGQPYGAALDAAGGSPPYSWFADPLPEGLVLYRGNGLIFGTPQSSGSPAIKIDVIDKAGRTATKVLRLEVKP